jgi:ribose 5-phosphate isomerase
VLAVPRLCELYPGICLTTEEKHGKTSVMVIEKSPDIPVAVVQYTFTHTNNTQNNTMTERNIHNNKNKNGIYITIRIINSVVLHQLVGPARFAQHCSVLGIN